jgi:hypothetical protein
MSPAGRRPVVVALLALLFQAVPPLLLWALAEAAYGQPRRLDEAWERPVSLAVVGGCGAVSLLLGLVGTYGLLRHARLWVAGVLIPTCCVPALLGGVLHLHALLVFLTAA